MEVHLSSLNEHHVTPILAIEAHTVTESDAPDFGFLPIFVIRLALLRGITSANIDEGIIGVVPLAVTVEVGRENRLSALGVSVLDIRTGHCCRITALEQYALRDTPTVGVDVGSIVTLHQIELRAGFGISKR